MLDEDPNTLSDHLPVVATLKTSCTLDANHNVNSNSKQTIKPFCPNWPKLSTENLVDCYTMPLEKHLQSIPLIDVPVNCCDSIDRVEEYVCQLSSTLLKVAKEKIPPKRYYKHLIPNWNDELKAAQLHSKSMYNAWKAVGSPSDKSNSFCLLTKLPRVFLELN